MSVIMAVPALLWSAMLVAVIVTVCRLITPTGARYSPVLLIEPTAGFTVHVMAVFATLPSAAVNCFVWPARSVADPGLTVRTAVGVSVIAA